MTLSPKSRVAQAAKALAALSMASADGDFIGSEDELLARLGVSRPTLRQAARSVEGQQLLAVKRGVNGGFYASRPNLADILQILSRYLALQGACLADVARVSGLISGEAVRLAAASPNAHQRERLRQFLNDLDGHDSAKAMITAETELIAIIAEMSGNPMIHLVMSIGLTFGHSSEPTRLFQSAEERAVARKLQRDLCTALIEGDGDIAEIMMQRRTKAFGAWLAETQISGGAE